MNAGVTGTVTHAVAWTARSTRRAGSDSVRAMLRSCSVVVLGSLAACAGTSAVAPAAEPASTSSAPAPHHSAPEHAHGSDAPACKLLARTCHAHDKASEQAHACHVLGHDAKRKEECEAKRAECLAVCGGDAGA